MTNHFLFTMSNKDNFKQLPSALLHYLKLAIEAASFDISSEQVEYECHNLLEVFTALDGNQQALQAFSRDFLRHGYIYFCGQDPWELIAKYLSDPKQEVEE